MRDRLSGRGFTLLEVLIAVFITAVIIAAVHGTFYLTHRALESSDSTLVKVHEARMVLDVLGRELDSAFTNDGNGSTAFKVQDRDYYGARTSFITFTAFSPRRPGLSLITYRVLEKDRELSLVKEISSPYAEENEPPSAAVIEGISEFSIRIKNGTGWTGTWDESMNKGRPDEIRVTMTLELDGRRFPISRTVKPVIGTRL